MKNGIAGVCTVALLSLLLSAPVSADILYSNGSPNGTIDGWFINLTGQVADSFTLSSTSTLTAVDNVGLWVDSEDKPSTVDWSIWSAPGPGGGGSELAGCPATATLTNTFLAAGTGFNSIYDIYSSSFLLPSIVLGPGSYWQQLENGTSGPTFAGISWDQNDSPLGNGTGSQAWQKRYRIPDRCRQLWWDGHSPFLRVIARSLSSSSGPTRRAFPEPSSVPVLVFGGLLLACFMRLKRLVFGPSILP